MNVSKDPVWGTSRRRPLAAGSHPTEILSPRRGDRVDRPDSEATVLRPSAEVGAFGPEAYQRAQERAYEHITRIQQESPYAAVEVVEHVVHDQRLYIGMWVIAAVAAVAAFLTFSLPCLLVSLVAVGFGLYSTPGRQTSATPNSTPRDGG